MPNIESLVDRVLEIDRELDAEEEQILRKRTLPEGISLVKRFGRTVQLPPPRPAQKTFFDVIVSRRSRRIFNPWRPVSLQQLSNILFSAAGVTARIDGIYEKLDYPFRASPSSGGLHGIDIYVVALRVDGLEPGVYYYEYDEHRLGVIAAPCYPYTLVDCLRQSELRNAPLLIILVADLSRGLWKYGKAYYKFCLVDAGVVAENIHLAATAEDLASVIVAGFDKQRVAEVLGLNRYEIPVISIVIGHGVRA